MTTSTPTTLYLVASRKQRPRYDVDTMWQHEIFTSLADAVAHAKSLFVAILNKSMAFDREELDTLLGRGHNGLSVDNCHKITCGALAESWEGNDDCRVERNEAPVVVQVIEMKKDAAAAAAAGNEASVNSSSWSHAASPKSAVVFQLPRSTFRRGRENEDVDPASAAAAAAGGGGGGGGATAAGDDDEEEDEEGGFGEDDLTSSSQDKTEKQQSDAAKKVEVKLF